MKRNVRFPNDDKRSNVMIKELIERNRKKKKDKITKISNILKKMKNS